MLHLFRRPGRRAARPTVRSCRPTLEALQLRWAPALLTWLGDGNANPPGPADIAESADAPPGVNLDGHPSGEGGGPFTQEVVGYAIAEGNEATAYDSHLSVPGEAIPVSGEVLEARDRLFASEAGVVAQGSAADGPSALNGDDNPAT